jgi:hypothetical protein
LLEDRTLGNREGHYYEIRVVLQNSGTVKSDELPVKFYDPEYNASLTSSMILSPTNYSLDLDESKVFYFSEWPTPLSGDVLLNISISPANPNVLTTSYNSEYYPYPLHIGSINKATSTPGFEIALLLIALVISLVSRKRNR